MRAVSRRNFLKIFGASLASLSLTTLFQNCAAPTNIENTVSQSPDSKKAIAGLAICGLAVAS